MVHSLLKLNTGFNISLNSGGSILLNAEGEDHTASSGFTKRQRMQIPQQVEQKQTIHISQKLRLHPYILQKIKLKILSEGINPLIHKLSQRIASFPNYTQNIIRTALHLDEPQRFFFDEKATEWSNAGVNDTEFFNLTSSFVGEVIWDPTTSGMSIELNSVKYNFCNVSHRTFLAFQASPSRGSYFSTVIRGNHDC